MFAVLNVLGSMLMLFSVTYVLPVLTSLIYRDGMLTDFLYAAAISVAVGAGLFAATQRHKRELRSRDGFLLVTLAWVFMSAIATVPLLIALPGLTFTDAFFETMSGLSTTGATVLTGLDSMAPSLNMWRATLHWFGGMGIIVLAVAILPLLGVGGMQLYKAETPGPVKNEKLTPRITQTAKALWVVYLLITISCVSALRLAGMDWYDAVFHGFSTVSLGGFSNYDASIGHFDSIAIEAVLIGFMLLAAVNFSRHFIAWQQKSLRTYLRDVEAGAMLAHLDRQQHARRHVDAGAAEFRGDVEAVEAHAFDLGDEARVLLARQLGGVGIELVLERHDLLAHEAAHLGDDSSLLFGRLEVHGRVPANGEW